MDILETIKSAADIAKKISNLELQQQLIDIQADFQRLQNENYELKKTNDELTRKLEEKKAMQYNTDDHLYYHKREDGSAEGPYCPLCWEKDNMVIHLQPFGLDKKCLKCGHVFGDKNEQKNRESQRNYFKNYW